MEGEVPVSLYSTRYDRDRRRWTVVDANGQRLGIPDLESKDLATDIAAALTVAYTRGRSRA